MEGLDRNLLSSNELCGGLVYQQRAPSPNEARPGLEGGGRRGRRRVRTGCSGPLFIIDLPKDERGFKKSCEVGKGGKKQPRAAQHMEMLL